MDSDKLRRGATVRRVRRNSQPLSLPFPRASTCEAGTEAPAQKSWIVYLTPSDALVALDIWHLASCKRYQATAAPISKDG